MHLQAIKALAAKSGDQGGVHVDDAPGIAPGEILAQDGEEARQHDQLDPVIKEGFVQRLLETLFTKEKGRNASLGCPLGHRPPLVADHQADTAACQRPRRLGIQQRLQVAAAA